MNSLLIEALDSADGNNTAGPSGGRFLVRIMRAGLSGNDNYYPAQTLIAAVPLFDGVRVFVKSDVEHLRGGGKDIRNLLGRLSEPSFVGEGAGELRAVLTLIDPAEPLAVKLAQAVSRGLTGLFGLSIDAEGQVEQRRESGRTVRVATAITRVRSVDLIVEPGAGGAVVSLLEAKDDQMLRQRLIDLIKEHRPALLDGLDVETMTDEELEALLATILAEQSVTGKAVVEPPHHHGVAGGDGETSPVQPPQEMAGLIEARLRASLRRTMEMRERIGRSRLPDRAKSRLINEFESRASFREADVDARVREEIDYLAPLARGGTVMDLGENPTFLGGQSRAEKFREALSAFWDPAHRDHRHSLSIKDLYVQATGDRRISGRLKECDQALLREALDGDDFVNVFLDSMNKRVIQVYRSYAEMEIWRDLATVVNVPDFREQKRVRWGGYGDLPLVAKNNPYLEMASPEEDDTASYSVKKRGRLESIALEDIKNDDVGFIRWIPTGLGRAAKRTLSRFVLDFLRTNQSVADGKALFHADHDNLITDPLSAAAFKKLRLRMKRQSEPGGADVIGVNPKFLWVPDALEETAYDLFTMGQRNDPDFAHSLKPAIRPVWYWTDENDWCLSADPLDVPTIEIGFLDGNQEPELWTQDSPTSGSLFSNDQVTYKVRHVYGGVVLDWRGLAKSVVPA